MKFEPTTEKDIEQLTRWIETDPYHNCLNPAWWLTGAKSSLLTFRFEDQSGVVCYVRLDIDQKNGQFCRLHTQFAPEQEVSKLRLAKSMFKGIPVVIEYCKQQGIDGIIFESISPTLIDFMSRVFGFQPLSGDDYCKRFDRG